MSNVLLLVPPDRQITRAIAAALDLAQRRRLGLIAAAVVDDTASARLPSHLVDEGLLAEKVSDQLSESLAREHQVRGKALLLEICEKATMRGIDCKTLIEEGELGAVCRRLMKASDVTIVVLVAEKVSWLGRILRGAQPMGAPDLGCEVLVVDED